MNKVKLPILATGSLGFPLGVVPGEISTMITWTLCPLKRMLFHLSINSLEVGHPGADPTKN